MKIQLFRVYDVHKHVKNELGREVTCKLITANEQEHSLMIKAGEETTTLDLFKSLKHRGSSHVVMFSAKELKAFIEGLKEMNVDVECSFMLNEITVGYAENENTSHVEGSYNHVTNTIVGLSAEGKSAISAILTELTYFK